MMLPGDIYKKNGIVIALSGPSGVGKGTIIDEVKKLRPGLKHSISYTTRQPRPGETDGVQYHFTDVRNFERMISEGDILEYDTYCGNYYGTPKAPLLECIDKGRDVILDITVPGSLAVMKNFPEAVTVFLLPPSFSELKSRLVKRGTESPGSLKNRLSKARNEVKMTEKFDYVLVNDDLKTTAERILLIIEAEKHRYKRLKGIERALLEN
jgi:guanylate kinase